MADAQGLARGIVAGCGASVGPLIGLELGVREPVLETSAQAPEGAFAVLPLDVELEAGRLARLELASPLEDLARIARRMLGSDDPDAKRELSAEERDAIGEILSLMGGAVDAALRELDPGLRPRALAWWRSDEPGDASFAGGAHLVARASLTVPGSPDVDLLLRLPPELLERAGSAPSHPQPGRVLFFEVEAETGKALARSLAAARIEWQQARPGDPELADLWPQVGAAIVSAASERGFEIARALRCGNGSWQLPLLMCAAAPTRALVIRALDCGASHVLAVPAPDAEVVRVLALARAR
jgi:hypothetical protein